MTRLIPFAVAALAACSASAPAPLSKTAAPATAVAAKTATPCFDGPPLVAATVFGDLMQYGATIAYWDGTSPLPTTDYGSCRVADGKIFAADDTVVADLHCGISVHVRGIVDHAGLEGGATGADIIARHRGNSERLVCAQLAGATTCWFRSAELEGEPTARYTVAAQLPGGRGRIDGNEAIELFGPAPTTRFMMTGYCH